MTKEGRAETRESKRSEQANQQAMSAKAASNSPSEGKGSTKAKEPKSPTERKNENKAQIREARMTSTAKRYGERYTPGMLTGGQAKIAAKAPPPNKIDKKDFAVLRSEKAKGRGMGLQDESVKPGKVQKANLGLMFKKKAKDKGAKGMEFLSPLAMLKRISGKKMGGVAKYKRGSGLDLPVISSVKPGSKVGKGKTKFKSMEAMRKAKGLKPGESASEFNKRRMKLAGAAKAVSATRIGKIALGVGAAGVAAQQYLKSKMKKDKNKKTLKDFREQKKPGVPSEKTKTINSALNKLNKKMGGGMMQKPMGYSKGTMIKARGCKLGRTRPTKIT